MSNAADPFVLANARIVLADAVIERGWVAVGDGRIAEIGEGRPPERGEDLAGDLLIPGLVELHTDHLEVHYVPRPKVYWDPIAAVVSYDAQLATSGITTVLDSVRIWREAGIQEVDGQHDVLSNAIATARDAGLLRADHFLHLRCEVPMPDVIADTERMTGGRDVRLISLMDHTPGQRQFRDEAKLRTYYRGKKGGLSDPELDELFDIRRRYQAQHAAANRRSLVELARRQGIPLASHDDTIAEHVAEAVADAVAIAEFPTTTEAAAALHQAGIKVLMGAPNLVRGGSHSGNVATADLAAAGVLDILSSDYVPSALLLGALCLPAAVPQFDLPAAIRTVSRTPAHAVGLDDRGEIAVGKRADLVRVYTRAGASTARAVWRAGRRVA
ncbi:MAG TPA: alpha-D-ribose 1-methylphosphonate 5-triphosphate diphosphatase [Xanthobacteraceae bacterium]|nr:alpha-D-ribose 1-methylphosphonate 5-triphosphate diphosphatase [Xanthobacteraceae bacterium]